MNPPARRRVKARVFICKCGHGPSFHDPLMRACWRDINGEVCRCNKWTPIENTQPKRGK